MTSDALSIHCPAKVNLVLSVGSPTASGMHPIASWMSLIDLGDTLRLQRIPSGPSRFKASFAPDTLRHEVIDWPMERDLMFRAHAAMEAATGRTLLIEADLAKRIPTGAGLGGGSSDAAGMLVGLNRLFALGLPTEELAAIAGTLGSDVVFLTRALADAYCEAIVTGTGDQLDPLPPREPFDLIVFVPPHHNPTGRIYAAFDAVLADGSRLPDELAVRRIALTQRPNPADLFNDLTEAAIRVTPELGLWRDRISSHLQQPVHITGSGAAMFVMATAASHAKAMAGSIRSHYDVPVIATQAGRVAPSPV